MTDATKQRRLGDLFGLEGKVAIVTGAASGIGEATALLLAEAGARVVVADIDMEGAANYAQRLVDMGFGAISTKVDIAEEGEVNAMVRSATEQFGGVDILINNAAFRPKAAAGRS